jgi:hypothetical protein
MPAFLNRGSLLAVQFRSPVFNASIVLLRTWNGGVVACGVDRVALFFAFARIFSYRRLILCAQLFCQPTGGAVYFLDGCRRGYAKPPAFRRAVLSLLFIQAALRFTPESAILLSLVSVACSSSRFC